MLMPKANNMKNLILCLLMFVSTTSAFGQKEFSVQEGDTTFTMKEYYFCLLTRGPNTGLDSLELATLQQGHMDHINAMAESGKLLIAGPFGDDGSWRGILILDVKNMEEARDLVNQDPMIKAGRLRSEIHPWWGAKGSSLK